MASATGALQSFLCPCLPPLSLPAVGLPVSSSLGESPSRAKRREEARPDPSRGVILDLGFTLFLLLPWEPPPLPEVAFLQPGLYLPLAPPVPRSEEGTILDVPSFLPRQPAAARAQTLVSQLWEQKGAACTRGPAAFLGGGPQLDQGDKSGIPQPVSRAQSLVISSPCALRNPQSRQGKAWAPQRAKRQRGCRSQAQCVAASSLPPLSARLVFPTPF